MSLSGNSYYRVLVSGIGALALVIGVFLGGVYVLKLLAPNKFSRNSDLIEIVDSCCLNRKNELLTIKWGSKLILLSSSLDRTVALSEIVDAKETERILNELQEQKKIRQDKTLSVVNFHNLFRKKTSE
ncbi:MAG: flagellar biosynthetic protein FliO [Thermoguttaceae bacterium]|nr:flagellar biosynthetic protein FliO [Thermoguttaceae bacterium]